MKKLFLILSFLMIAAFSFAQEGMWLLTQIGQLDLAKKGLKIPVTDVYSPGKPCIANAVVQLGGGTASFVSPEGLLITNHHVAYTALQRSSSVSDDLLTNGFLARERSAEIQAPGYRARLLTDMKDVTDEVLAVVKGITDPVERDKKINEKIEIMTEAISKKEADLEAEVVPMFNGKSYIEYIHRVFKDIRIVYSPPLAIGNYGGETDNWMWPRHTGDFSFLRVYATKDGKGAEYSPDNVPYKPKVWLKVAQGDLKDGDFNFIIGYPGFTTRYRSSTSVQWNMEYNYPFAIKNFQEVIALADELTKNDPAGKIKVASMTKGLANVMKNYQGKLDGMKNTNFLQEKLDYEKEFQAWANADPKRKAKYGDILAKEKAQYTVIEKTRERDNVFGIFQGLSGTILGEGMQVYGISEEMGKPAADRDPGFNEEAVGEFADGLKYAYNDYYEPLDKALLERVLKMASELPQGQRITGLEYLFANKSKTINQLVDEAYAATKLKDPEFVKGLLKKTPAELDALNDPFLKIAASIYPMSEEIRKTSMAFGANVTELRKVYLDGLYEWKGTGMYPDANSTIRFTWGPVKGYKPADAVWYYPFTSLQGVVDKNTGVEPFNAPVELVSLQQKKDFGRWADPELNDVPVAFINQCDITGGNSGSPVMNAKGEIIGVAFDGNYEAMISDWQYDYNLQRCIAVDIRYVLFITEKYGKASFLLDEMGVAR
jgi:hypothetical protein